LNTVVAEAAAHQLKHTPVEVKPLFQAVVNVPSADDYDRSAWSAYPPREQHKTGARHAEGTAEVLTALSKPFNPSVCFMVESALRQGYNVTMFALPLPPSQDYLRKHHDERHLFYTNHEKERRSYIYGKLQRERILQQLGLSSVPADVDLSTLSLFELGALKIPKRGSDADVELNKYLELHPHLYVFADAYDVLFQLPPRELHRKFNSFSTEDQERPHFLVSGEANQFPYFNDTEVDWYPDRNNSLFPFVNSGLWVAPLTRMIPFNDHVFKANYTDCKQRLSYSDQCKMMVAVSDPSRRFTAFPIERDVNATLFQSMAPHANRRGQQDIDPALFHPMSHLGMTPEGLLTRKDVANTPVAVHWNGRAKRFNNYNHTVTIDLTATDFTVYRSLGWLRRPQREPQHRGQPPVYFDITYDELLSKLVIYNEHFQVDRKLIREFYTLCTTGLGGLVDESSKLLASLHLISS